MRPWISRLVVIGSLVCGPWVVAAERPVKDLYLSKCALCHGRDGRPNPAMAQARIPDFTSAQFHDQRSDAALRSSIDNGKPGTLMRAFRAELSEQERSALVRHVRSLRGTAKAKPSGQTRRPK